MRRCRSRKPGADGMLGLIVLLQALTLAVGGPPSSAEYLPLRVAQAEGYFTREGLDVTLATRDGKTGAEALALGRADLAAVPLEAMLRFGPRWKRQRPVVVFGLSAAPPVALLVPTSLDADVRSVADLAGKRIGIAAPGAPEYAWLTGLLGRARRRLTQVEVVSLGSRRLAVAVAAGTVHAGLVRDPAAAQLVDEGRARVLLDLRTPEGARQAMGAPTLNAAVFVRADRRPDDPLLAAFARAVLDAERLLAEAEAAELAARLPAQLVGNPEQFRRRVQASRGLWLPGGHVEPEQVRETVALVRDRMPLPPTLELPRPEDMLHMGPVTRAARER